MSSSTPAASPIEHRIDARARDIGGFAVGRVLPAPARRLVGPFIFLDHMGPAVLAPGEGVDVRPHPHIGIATVTYLFEGEVVHRDSVGSVQAIRPGEINWMTAGRGVVHSERTSPEGRAAGSTLHGLQLWVALPRDDEECAPDFRHHDRAALPVIRPGGATVRVLAGAAYGAASPVRTCSPLFYLDAALPDGCALPVPAEHEERAVYVVEGTVECAGERAGKGRMLVIARGANVDVRAAGGARVVMLGGAPIEGPRHIWWNFVSSVPARIEAAKLAWSEGRFPVVPGDALDPVPLPAS